MNKLIKQFTRQYIKCKNRFYIKSLSDKQIRICFECIKQQFEEMVDSLVEDYNKGKDKLLLASLYKLIQTVRRKALKERKYNKRIITK